MKKISWLLVWSVVLLYACGGKPTCETAPNVDDIKVNVKIIRLDSELAKLKDKKAIANFLKKYPDFAEQYMQQNRMPSDTIAIDQIYAMIREPHLDTVFQDVAEKYKDLTALKNEFEQVFRYLKHYYPDFKIPKIYTTITGLGSFYGTDLMVTKEMIVISLDFFMGNRARYRPPVELMPDYIWRRYSEASIVPTVVMGISNRYNKTNFEDKTAVAEMIYYGKAYHFTKAMMPCLPDSVLFGYTTQELNNIEDDKNRQYIWAHLIDKQVLFNTNQKIIQLYMGERPFVAEINKECPGRIGHWLGFRMVRKYLSRQPEVTLQALMENTEARQIFNQSGYNAN